MTVFAVAKKIEGFNKFAQYLHPQPPPTRNFLSVLFCQFRDGSPLWSGGATASHIPLLFAEVALSALNTSRSGLPKGGGSRLLEKGAGLEGWCLKNGQKSPNAALALAPKQPSKYYF